MHGGDQSRAIARLSADATGFLAAGRAGNVRTKMPGWCTASSDMAGSAADRSMVSGRHADTAPTMAIVMVLAVSFRLWCNTARLLGWDWLSLEGIGLFGASPSARGLPMAPRRFKKMITPGLTGKLATPCRQPTA
jgi:hypothetical protein